MSQGHSPPLPDDLTQPLYGDEAGAVSLKQSNLYATWKDRLKTENDYIVVIAASSKTELSGTGKSTLAVQLARLFDESDTHFDAEEQASLSSKTVHKELYPNLPKRSSILFDEAQGTANSDGVDNRRGMADAVMKMSRAAATYRYKQHALVLVTQSTRWIDSRMMDLIDRLILIQETNQEEGWARAVVFDHYFDDLASDKQEYTPAIEDIVWRPLPESDPDYQALHEMKQEAGDPSSSAEEDDTSLTKEQQIELANHLRWEENKKLKEIVAHPMIEYKRNWVSEHTQREDDE